MNLPNYKIEKIKTPDRTGYLPYSFAVVLTLSTLLNEGILSVSFSAPEKAKKMRFKNIILSPTVKNSSTGNLILPASYDSWLQLSSRNGALLTGNNKSKVVNQYGCLAAAGDYLHCEKGENLFFDTEMDLGTLPTEEALYIDSYFRINTPSAVAYMIDYRIQIIGDYSIT